MAASVQTVITEEAYTIDIKAIAVKAEAMAAAKFGLRESRAAVSSIIRDSCRVAE
jgi:hypothetical protein